MKAIIKYGVLFSVILLVAGCTLEQKLAMTFVQDRHKEDFLIMPPEFIYKYNLKTYEIPGFDSLGDLQKDSLLLERSLFLKSINDSIVISRFTDNFTRGLKAYGIKIYPENYLDSLLVMGKSARILHFAQFSIEEYVHPYSSEEVIGDEIISIGNIDLNALNFNVWLELSVLNSEGSQKVLFGTDYLLDELDGILKQYFFSGDMRFEYTIDTIKIDRIYRFAGEFGNRMAGLLYDYYLNNYIDENLPEDYQFERFFYHYDPAGNTLYPIEPEQRLIELK